MMTTATTLTMMAPKSSKMTGFEKLMLTKVSGQDLLVWLELAESMKQRLNLVEDNAVYEPFRDDNFAFSITDLKNELASRPYVPGVRDKLRKKKQENNKRGRQRNLRATKHFPVKF